jgi:uncharacterized protein (TIGR02285 family)
MNRLILSLLFFAFLITSPAEAGNTIKWIISMEPPITYQNDGKYEGYGIEILKILQKNMKEYDHKILVAGNYERLTFEVRKGPLTCALGLFKTEDRKKNMYFSKVPVFYFFNVQVVLRKNIFEKMNKPEAVSLYSMLEQNKNKLGISKGRTYSKKIRDILKKFEGSDNIYIGAQGNVAESLLHMLINQRIDYMFLYPEEATYLSRKLGYKKNIVTVPIKEASDLGYSWAACTKNDEGKKVISKISEILSEIRKKDSYRSLYEEWLSENLLPAYRLKYNEIFLKMNELINE